MDHSEEQEDNGAVQRPGSTLPLFAVSSDEGRATRGGVLREVRGGAGGRIVSDVARYVGAM